VAEVQDIVWEVILEYGMGNAGMVLDTRACTSLALLVLEALSHDFAAAARKM
jgi:hypothetical protein